MLCSDGREAHSDLAGVGFVDEDHVTWRRASSLAATQGRSVCEERDKRRGWRTTHRERVCGRDRRTAGSAETRSQGHEAQGTLGNRFADGPGCIRRGARAPCAAPLTPGLSALGHCAAMTSPRPRAQRLRPAGRRAPGDLTSGMLSALLSEDRGLSGTMERLTS